MMLSVLSVLSSNITITEINFHFICQCTINMYVEMLKHVESAENSQRVSYASFVKSGLWLV